MNAVVRAAARSSIRRQGHQKIQEWSSSSSLLFHKNNNLHPRWLSSSTTSLAPTPEHGNLPAKLIDFSISAKIEGEESQVAIVTLQPGETLRAESGAMLFMTHGVEMNTDLQGASAAFSRMMTGQNVFLTDYTYHGDKGQGTVGLGTEFPSKILRLSLEDYEGSTIICQRGAYMASNPTVDISMEATKSLGAGFFGGQGFILQRLTGQGDVLVKAGGTLVEKDLQEGETLRVTSGSIVAFTGTVDYDIQMMPGVKNVMFGGEGLFVTKLTGPGRVWLQGMPPDRMIAEIASRVPGRGPGIGIPIGGGAGGDGGGAAEGEGGEDGAGESQESGEEMVAATDQAIDADRQATVAASGMASEVDPDSPSALYGDAAPKDDPAPSSSPTDDPFASSDSGTSQETTFSDNDSAFSDETSFSDETTFSDTEFKPDQEQSNFWGDGGGGDQTQTDVYDDSGSAGGAGDEEGGSSIISTLWDMFMGGDDDD